MDLYYKRIIFALIISIFLPFHILRIMNNFNEMDKVQLHIEEPQFQSKIGLVQDKTIESAFLNLKTYIVVVKTSQGLKTITVERDEYYTIKSGDQIIINGSNYFVCTSN